MDKAKVGDKILVVDAQLTEGKYKNGDILTVKFRGSRGVTVEEHDGPLLHREYTVLPDIKVGDTVTLIDDFYNHEAFKALSRSERKDISQQAGKEIEAAHIWHGRVHSDGLGLYTVPLALLRKVEPKTDGDINIVISGIENLKPTKHRYTAEQEREARELIGKIVAEMEIFEAFYFLPAAGKETDVRHIKHPRSSYKTYIARCSPNDEFSQTIGRMVALCKATGTPLPEWVKP